MFRHCEQPDIAWQLTIKGNSVAVVSDGSAVLGLGNIGPEAAMPVMEGKAMLFKEFAGINAYPICLRTQATEEIINTVANLSVGFGGINLEDISAPRCFEIEQRLQERLDIPVFHDDQHGTAVVVLAALLNASRLAGRKLARLRIVILGAGAAGTAIAVMLRHAEVKDIVVCDRKGILNAHTRTDLNEAKTQLAAVTNLTGVLSQHTSHCPPSHYRRWARLPLPAFLLQCMARFMIYMMILDAILLELSEKCGIEFQRTICH